jgi:hypothetical protein
VVNVTLASLLNRRGVLSANPERSIPIGERGRGVPDIALAEISGLPVIIEGRIGDKPGVDESLDVDCPRRIEDGLAEVVVGLVYPKEVRAAPSVAAIEEILSTAELHVKVFSDAGNTDWTSTDLDGLSSLLRRTYESLAKESVVETLVGQLKDAIEISSRKLAQSEGTAARLKEVLIVPKSD